MKKKDKSILKVEETRNYINTHTVMEVEILCDILRKGIFYHRERSDDELLSDIYFYMDNLTYVSAEEDLKNMKKDMRNIYSDLKKSIQACEEENLLSV